jgi:hypothetical protein
MLDIKIRRQNREVIGNFKKQCAICGESTKCCLEIHHLHEKRFNVSQAANYTGTEELKKELKRCICLCANCHKKVHAGLYKA